MSGIKDYYSKWLRKYSINHHGLSILQKVCLVGLVYNFMLLIYSSPNSVFLIGFGLFLLIYSTLLNLLGRRWFTIEEVLE